MTASDRNKKRIAEVGWMPFWWGNKFSKRLASKRARKYNKTQLKRSFSDRHENIGGN